MPQSGSQGRTGGLQDRHRVPEDHAGRRHYGHLPEDEERAGEHVSFLGFGSGGAAPHKPSCYINTLFRMLHSIVTIVTIVGIPKDENRHARCAVSAQCSSAKLSRCANAGTPFVNAYEMNLKQAKTRAAVMEPEKRKRCLRSLRNTNSGTPINVAAL